MPQTKSKTFLSILALTAAFVLALVLFVFCSHPSAPSANISTAPQEQPRLYEALIQTKGSDAYETPEDRRTFFENGDVMAVFPKGHPWTSAEREELIATLNLTPSEAERLLEPITRPAPAEKESGPGKAGEETLRLRAWRLRPAALSDPAKILESSSIEKK